MHGAVYGTLLLAVVAVLALAVNPLLAIGLLLVATVGLFVLGGGSKLKEAKVGAGPGPSGVPTTRDASYTPADRS